MKVFQMCLNALCLISEMRQPSSGHTQQRHSYPSPVLGQVEYNEETLAQLKLTKKGGEVEMNADFSAGELMSPCRLKIFIWLCVK